MTHHRSPASPEEVKLGGIHDGNPAEARKAKCGTGCEGVTTRVLNRCSLRGRGLQRGGALEL